jgi:RNA polymerase sigma factor (sigma-70 family)
MEAASAILRDLPARRRQRSFECECERLRPLGEAFVLRRFGDTLNRADAEDVVADVLIRLHRRVGEGYRPENLRAVFFTSVRNAAIDLLRSRSAKPTVALEAAASAPAQGAAPAERAESDEDAVRLQEALARMRENYREAILLRFGLGLTVPEIAQHLSISLPAAKKLVLRSTRQVKDRLAAIEGAEFCPEMRAMARRSLLEKQASGLASESEAEILRTHFQHCGSCKSFLASLHGALHELGTAAVFGLTVGDHLVGRVGVLDHVARWATSVTDTAQAGVGRMRHLGFKLTGAFQSTDSPASGILVGTSQKIAAVCTAGAATTATCLLTGAVGPGIGASAPAEKTPAPPPQVRTVPSAETEPVPVAPTPTPAPEPAPSPKPSSDSSPAPESNSTPPAVVESAPAPAPAESEPSGSSAAGEFGIEGGSSSAPAPAPAPTPSPTPSASSGGSSGAPSSGSSTSHSSGGGTIGFQG